MNKQEQIISTVKGNTNYSNLVDEKIGNYRFVMFIDESRDRTRLIMFRGRSSRFYTNTSFSSSEIQAKTVNEYEKMAIKEMEKEIAEKARLKATKVTDSYKVGGVLYDSWGYSMTYTDYYQIVGFKGQKTAIIRQLSKETISGDGFSGTTSPKLNAFVNETTYEVRIDKWGGLSGKVDHRRASLSKWDGKPKYYNSLD